MSCRFAVAEIRPAVAAAAGPLADEDLQAALRGLGIHPGLDRLAARERVAEAVERRGRAAQRFDERGEGLADIREHRLRRRSPKARAPKLGGSGRRAARPCARRSATWRGLEASSRASRIGRRLCAAQAVGGAVPAEPAASRAFISVGVLRSTSAAAAPRVRLSVQLRSGTWQVAQANLPLPERRVSKNRRSPNSIASGLPETRLPGSPRRAPARGRGRGWRGLPLSVNGGGLRQRRPRPAGSAGRGPRARTRSRPSPSRDAMMWTHHRESTSDHQV